MNIFINLTLRKTGSRGSLFLCFIPLYPFQGCHKIALHHLQDYKKLPNTRHTHGKKTLKIFEILTKDRFPDLVWDLGDVVKEMDLGEQVDEV